MIIAVGSTRGPKVEAVRRVLGALAVGGSRASTGAEVVAFDASFGAPPMPLSPGRAAGGGARARPAGPGERWPPGGRRADFAVGLEGGIDLRRTDPFEPRLPDVVGLRHRRAPRGPRLRGRDRGALRRCWSAVVERGIELSEAMDALSGEHGVRRPPGRVGRS